ncbi:protein RGF1 INDUCIBLE TRANSCRIPTION FACTOR [Trifolium repens]|nr:protein RGF1 INDUCIBLE TRANSCRIPTION FACTOR [Trifolium repens]
MDMMHVPWLEKLWAITTFFTTCEVHPNDPKNECNKFCIDCIDNPLCESCVKSHHRDHNVIQIRRSSYNEVVKTTEIYKHVDILGIQTYVINSSTVVFLNKRTRPHPKRNNIGKIGHITNYLCKTCDRNLVDASWFCSLACKKNGGFPVNPKEMEEMEKGIDEENDDGEEKEGNKESTLPVNCPSASFRKPNSRRKGIPHRAPFF